MGISLVPHDGRAAVCAETIALGQATTAEHGVRISTIVAVSASGQVVLLCDLCRALIFDYGPNPYLILPPEDTLANAPIGGLLPVKYRRD